LILFCGNIDANELVNVFPLVAAASAGNVTPGVVVVSLKRAAIEIAATTVGTN
jgi:hypothetical protein